MRFDQYINECLITEGIFQKHMKKLSNKSSNAAKKLFRNSWVKMVSMLKEKELEKDALDIINKHLNTNYRNLDQVTKANIAKMPSKKTYENVNEDFKHYWEKIKAEAFPALSFYPALQVFLELDKLLKGTGEANYIAMVVYGVFWALLVSGNFLKGWLKWKKENPEEYEKEGSRRNPLAIK